MKGNVILLLLLLSHIYSQAQDSTQIISTADSIPSKPEVEAGNGHFVLQLGIPSSGMQQAIRNEMGNLGFGGSLMVVFNPLSWGKNKRNGPFRIGAEFGYTYYGRFINEVEINGYKGDYKTSYGIINLNAVFQLRPPVSKGITPYASFLLGGSFYVSNIKENLNALESALGIEGIDLDSYNSASFNKGIGLGFKIDGPRPSGIGFGLHASYNWGSDIKYIVRNSLSYSNGSIVYEVGEAPVRYFLVQFGISF